VDLPAQPGGEEMKYLSLSVGIHPGCGGTIWVTDWGRAATRGFRYEACCSKCRQCDPNGYGNTRELMIGAKEYFQISEASTPEAVEK
jgi:hypothetical protein